MKCKDVEHNEKCQYLTDDGRMCFEKCRGVPPNISSDKWPDHQCKAYERKQI
jgi:hypothetical protein